MTATRYDIADPGLAELGRGRIGWAADEMPVLAGIRARFGRERSLSGLRVSACLHITAETANLARTLKAGGADVVLCASNPLSTQDDVAAALVEDDDIPVFARRGEDTAVYYAHIRAALDHRPQITLDDGADLVSELHKHRTDLLQGVLGGTEETTTGVIANAGHFNVEIDIPALESMAAGKTRPRAHVEEYTLGDGRRIRLLAEGRLVNLAAAEGHPAAVMDMSFANQALSVAWLAEHAQGLAAAVHPVPLQIDQEVARLKLAALGMAIDTLTPEQAAYLSSWEEGT